MSLVGLSPIADIHVVHYAPPTLPHQPQDGSAGQKGVVEDSGDVGAGGGVLVEQLGDEVLGEGELGRVLDRVLVGVLVGVLVSVLVVVLVGAFCGVLGRVSVSVVVGMLVSVLGSGGDSIQLGAFGEV